MVDFIQNNKDRYGGQFMPVFARAYMQVPAFIRFTNVNAHNAVNNDCTGKIFKKENVPIESILAVPIKTSDWGKY